MKQSRFIFLFIIIVLLGLVFWLASRQKTAPQASSDCDQSLWQHVYHPERLKVIEACKTVTGMIEHIKQEPDGDMHIRLKPDSQFAALVNDENKAKQQGDLVLEPVCVGTATQKDAVAACRGVQNRVIIPPVGTHVKVIGSYVSDLEHGGWMEIHPVSVILAIP